MNRFLKFPYQPMEDDPGAAGGGSGNTDPGTDPGSGSGGETFTMNVDGKDVQFPKQYQEAIGKIIAKSRSEVERKFKPRLDELNNALQSKETSAQELQDILNRIEEEKLSEKEKLERQAQRKIDEANKNAKTLQEQAERNFDLFKNTKIQSELFAALSGFELNNSQQTMHLMRQLGQADIVEEDGRHKVVLKYRDENGEEELSPKQFAEKWLGLEENAHHLRAYMRPGGGTSTGGRAGANGARKFSLAEWQSMVASAKPEEQRKLIQQKARGEVIIAD